jgi:glycopeptide antibiotics resistance protein
MPFDFMVSFDELSLKYTEGKVRLNPWPGAAMAWPDALSKAALNLACFLPLGFLCGIARPRDLDADARPGFPWAALATPALVESLQYFVYSRTCDAADVITGMVGILVGWRMGRRLSASIQFAPMALKKLSTAIGRLLPLLFLVWLATVVYVYWRPFNFTTDPSQFGTDRDELQDFGFRRLTLAPFVDYYWGSKYNALDQFVRKALAFLPLGILIALSLRDLYRRGVAYWTVLIAFVIATGLEVGRYFLPSRSPSTTDIMIACGGAWVGFQIMQRFRVLFWAESALYGWSQEVHQAETPQLHWINR